MVEPGRPGLSPAGARNPEHRAALESLFSRIGELTKLPPLTASLLAGIQQSLSPAELEELIATDPPSIARILRRVNTASRDQENLVPSISAAIEQSGVDQVRSIALTASLSYLFTADQSVAKPEGYSREELWSYSIAIAKAAALIATWGGEVAPPIAYAAGLMHEIGYFLLDQHLQSHYLRFVALARHRAKQPAEIIQLEQEIFSFNHASLGGYAAVQWGLPSSICEVIEHHYGMAEYQGEHGCLLGTIVLGKSLCSELGLTALSLATCSPHDNTALEAAHISAVDREELLAELELALHEELPAISLR